MAAFTLLAVADRDFASPLNEDVIDALYNRDEELRVRPFYLPHVHEHIETSESYVEHEAWQLYIPLAAKQGFMAFQMRRNGDANSVQAQCKIGGLTSSEISTTNGNYSDEPVFWCIFTDLSTVEGTEVAMTFELKRTGASGGSPQGRAQEADGPVSYFKG